MTTNNEIHYEVGYRRPPVATRFPKGRSGNPHGRPKKQAEEFDPGKLLQSIDNEEVVVKINGKRKRMRKGEIYFRQLFTKALGGNLSDARLIANMAPEYFEPEAEGPSEETFIFAADEERHPNETRSDHERKMCIKSNPPKGTRFNERSRQVSMGSQFRKVAKENVSIEVGGAGHKISLWEAYVRHIYTMALGKNSSAARLLDQLRKQFPGAPLSGDPIVFRMRESDAGL
jgi:predicted DNA-binding ribbon-helix-helix protein